MTDQTDTVDEPLFTALELEQFDEDDVVAGAAIGKMLSLLFLYTVLAMSGVVWWTFDSVRNRDQSESEATVASPATGSAEPAEH